MNTPNRLITHSPNHRFAVLFLALLCFATHGVRAAAPPCTTTVTTTADSGPGSLRGALTCAADGDTIDATGVSGTITLTTGELLVTNSVTILGPGVTNLAVNGNAASRVFHIGSGTTVTIASLTITNGADSSGIGGAGIYNDHSTLTVSNCTVSGNLVGNGPGGGIFNYGQSSGSAMLTIVNSTVSGNSAGGTGGGIYNDAELGSATVKIINSTLSGNSADRGGGIYSDGEDAGSAALTVMNSTFSGNSATYGGGIFNDGVAGSATLKIVNSTLSDNSAGSGGGGIYINGQVGNGLLTIGSTILNTGTLGGNIFNSSGTVTSDGYNLSSDDGGGFLTATGDQTKPKTP